MVSDNHILSICDDFVQVKTCCVLKDIVGNSQGGLLIKSDGGQNIKGTKVFQKLYPRVH